MIKIHTLILGLYQVNCYIVHKDYSQKCLIIDPGDAPEKILHFLQEKGQEVIVLEAKEIASGQTKNTTAKITSQHGLIYHKIKQKYGIDTAGLLGKAHTHKSGHGTG